MARRKVVIVGGGISGLSAAFYLQRRGIGPTIIDPSRRLGGLIQTDLVLGCLLEAGPDSFLGAKPAVSKLAGELGIAESIIGSNDALRRVFIVRKKQLVPMPQGMVMMVPTDIEAVETSPLFSEDTRRRLQAEEALSPFNRGRDFSVGELVEEHFGAEVLEYIAEPLLAAVYGGDPAHLSARSVLPRFVEYESSYGSLVKASRLEARVPKNGGLFLSFKEGMGQLTTALVDDLISHTKIVRDAAVQLEKLPANGYRIHCRENTLDADEIILATPAHIASDLTTALDDELAQQLSAIPYSSAILVTFLFAQESFGHPLDGFGFLVPRPERQIIAAATWINTKFPSRIAPGLIGVRAFLVDPEAALHSATADSDVANSALRDLHRIMRISSAPVHTTVHRWPNSMPQYLVGHGRRLAHIQQRLQMHRGLQLASNYLDGVGIPDCVRWGEYCATKVA